MRTRVRLPPAIRRTLERQAQEARPRECCGFLLGRGAEIVAAIAMANVSDRPDIRYKIDDADHVALRRLLRGMTPPLEIVGVYHSHPQGEAVPSPTDITEAYYPDWVHVIVGLGGGTAAVRAWRIADGQAHPLSLAERPGIR